MTTYEKNVAETPISVAPPARLVAGPAECAAWQHAVDEAALAVSQMSAEGGGHASAIATGSPYSVADTTPRRIPSSPGQQPVMDNLIAMHEHTPGQGQ